MTNHTARRATADTAMVDNGAVSLQIEYQRVLMETPTDSTIVDQAIDRLNQRALSALELARDEAIALGEPYVGCHHLLIGLAADSASAASRVLQALGLPAEALRARVRFIAGCNPASSIEPAQLPLSPRLCQVIVAATGEATRRGHTEVGTIHLLVAIAKERAGVAIAAVELPGVGLEPLGREILQAFRNGATD